MASKVSSYWNLHRLPILMSLACILFYSSFAYDLERTDFTKLISLYLALFFLCYKLIQFEKWNFNFLFVIGILFRMTFLFSEPNLSQDYFRFIWDGSLIIQGLNPYLFTPDSIMESAAILIPNGEILHQNMGSLSARNFSNYPPLNQMLFALSAFVGGKTIVGTVLSMRTLIILGDIGIYYFGKKLLRHLNKSPHLIFWYFLNPLVIIELTGNLHFEGIMLFFFIWSLCLIVQNRWVLGGILFAFSILVKLIPLMFLPLFFAYFGFKKSLKFYLVVLLTIALCAWPFYAPEFLDNYTHTVGLWFSNFEFNAGIFNAVKEIAVQCGVQSWRVIKVYGRFIPVIIIVMVSIFSVINKKKSLNALMLSMFWVLTVYYLLSSTVHPWYIIFVVFLSLYTDYKFPLVWSCLVFLSYAAYGNSGFEENYILLLIEYFVLFAIMVYEIFIKKGKLLSIQKN